MPRLAPLRLGKHRWIPSPETMTANKIRSVALRTAYNHHAANAGYKTILLHTHPQAIFGVDECNPAMMTGLRRKYMWLAEFDVAQYVRKHAIDVVHVLYGEEYYRFLGRLLPNTPIVATFHQPADMLYNEVTQGNLMGRVAGLAHKVNKDRFSRLSAAIVMTAAQKEVLKTVMAADKIHIVPLGVDVAHLSAKFTARNAARSPFLVLSVGNWQRDWGFYFKVVGYCQMAHPEWRFVLVNKRLPEAYRAQVPQFPNLTFRDNVSDNELYELYLRASVQFMPFLSAAGNNSFNESLALGCPVVTNIAEDAHLYRDKVVTLYPTSSVEAAVEACLYYTQLLGSERETLAIAANAHSREKDWPVVAQRTLEIYQSVL